MAKAIIINEPESKWKESIQVYIKTPKEPNPDKVKEIDELMLEHDLTDWDATIVSQSKI